MYRERAPLRLSFMCAKSVPNKIRRHTRYENADADEGVARITVNGIRDYAPADQTKQRRADRVPGHSKLRRGLIAPAQNEKAARRQPEEDPIHRRDIIEDLAIASGNENQHCPRALQNN